MNDSSAMRAVERARDLNGIADDLIDRERGAVNACLKGFTFEILHDEERRALVLADVIESADVRMIKRGNRPGFVLESLSELRIAGELGSEHLDGDDAIEPRIACLVDLAHPAATEQRQNFIGTETGTGRNSHG
jgi:hypothetical protein